MTKDCAQPFDPIEDPRLRDMAQQHFGALKTMVEESETELAPMLLLETASGELIPVVITEDMKKDRVRSYLSLALMVRRLGAVRAVWGSEGWMVMAAPKGEMPRMPLSEHPERVDCLIIVAFSADSVYGASFPILHTDDGRRVTMPMDMPQGTEWGGMITDFLQKALIRL
ncbi:MAG: hypothetical protein ABIH46_13875 [Chloroflexota bacterium]